MNKKENKKRLIYARYAAPLLSQLLLIIYMLIPKIRFSLDGEKKESVSALELLKNSFDNARYHLFSANAQQTPESVAFFKAIFAVVIAVTILFLISSAIFIISAAIFGLAFSDKKSADERKRLKNLYTTFIPNRVVLSIFLLFSLPISFLPEIVVFLYEKIPLYPVSVKHELFVAPWMLALALFAASAVLIFLAKKQEKRCKLDIFESAKPITEENEADEADVISKRTYTFARDNNTTEEERLSDLFNKKND